MVLGVLTSGETPSQLSVRVDGFWDQAIMALPSNIVDGVNIKHGSHVIALSACGSCDGKLKFTNIRDTMPGTNPPERVSQKTPLRLLVPYSDGSIEMDRVLDPWELHRTLSSSSVLTLKF